MPSTQNRGTTAGPTLPPFPSRTHDQRSITCLSPQRKGILQKHRPLTLATKGSQKLRSWSEHGPCGLAAQLGALSSLLFQSREEKVNRVLGPGGRPPALLTTPPQPRLAPTHPHLLVTYLRRSTAQAVCQGGNDISSGTAKKLQTAAEEY